MKTVAMTNETVNEMAKVVYGEGAYVTVHEEMDTDVVIVMNGDKITRIIELEDAMLEFGKAFNQNFVSYRAAFLGELGFGYAFEVDEILLPELQKTCA